MYMPACELFLCAMGACVCFGLVVLFFSCSVYLLSLLFEREREREREREERERLRSFIPHDICGKHIHTKISNFLQSPPCFLFVALVMLEQI